MKTKRIPPVLIDAAQVRTLLGRTPRGLDNKVMFDPAGRKLFSYREVIALAITRAPPSREVLAHDRDPIHH